MINCSCVHCSYHSGENSIATVESAPALTKSPRYQIQVPSSQMLADPSHLQQPYPADTDIVGTGTETDRLVADETMEYEYKPSTWPRKRSPRQLQPLNYDDDDSNNPARLAANQYHEIRKDVDRLGENQHHDVYNDSGRLATNQHKVHKDDVRLARYQHDHKATSESVSTTSFPPSVDEMHYDPSPLSAVEQILAASSAVPRHSTAGMVTSGSYVPPGTASMAPAASTQYSDNFTRPISSYSVQQQASSTQDSPGVFLYPYTGGHSPSHIGQRSPVVQRSLAVERSPVGHGSPASHRSPAFDKSVAGQGSPMGQRSVAVENSLAVQWSPAVQRSAMGQKSLVGQSSAFQSSSVRQESLPVQSLPVVERSPVGQGSLEGQSLPSVQRSPLGQSSLAVERLLEGQRSPMAVQRSPVTASGSRVTMVADGRHAVDMLFDNLYGSSLSSQYDATPLSAVSTTGPAIRTFPPSPHVPAHSPHIPTCSPHDVDYSPCIPVHNPHVVDLCYLSDESRSHSAAADLSDTCISTASADDDNFHYYQR